VKSEIKYEPEVVLSQLAWSKIHEWVKIAPGEISGLGSVTRESEDVFYVDDVYLLEQECDASETELKEEPLAKFLSEWDASGKDVADLRFWWHSHANMAAFWSGQDDRCVENCKNSAFWVSMVINKKNEHLTRVDFWNPFRMKFDQVDLSVRYPSIDVVEQCKEDYERCVTHVTYYTRFASRTTYMKPGWNGYGADWWPDGDDDVVAVYHKDGGYFTPGKDGLVQISAEDKARADTTLKKPDQDNWKKYAERIADEEKAEKEARRGSKSRPKNLDSAVSLVDDDEVMDEDVGVIMVHGDKYNLADLYDAIAEVDPHELEDISSGKLDPAVAIHKYPSLSEDELVTAAKFIAACKKTGEDPWELTGFLKINASEFMS